MTKRRHRRHSTAKKREVVEAYLNGEALHAPHRRILKDRGFVGSMSRRGNPYDNAQAESFMKTIKVEAVYPMEYETFEDVAADLTRMKMQLAVIATRVVSRSSFTTFMTGWAAIHALRIKTAEMCSPTTSLRPAVTGCGAGADHGTGRASGRRARRRA